MEFSALEIDKRTLSQYYDRLLRSDHRQKLQQLRFIWNYIHHSPAFTPIIDDIKTHYEVYSQSAYNVFSSPHAQILPEHHLERFYLSYYLIHRIISESTTYNTMHQIGHKYNPDTGTHDSNFKTFNDLFLEQFTYFFLNQADRTFYTQGLLKKYKLRSEWFNREKLFSLQENNTGKAERVLKQNLYKYLFDQGLDIFIEPSSPSGEVDIYAIEGISSQKSLIEAKIFDGANRGNRYIVGGYHQMNAYMKDHHESQGYLIIFNCSGKELRLNFSNNSFFPVIQSNGRTIYFITIDIFGNLTPASKIKRTEYSELSVEDFI